MADISQITQELTPFGPAPDSLDPATFNQRGDATVKHLHTHVDEQNTVVEQTNQVIAELNTRAADIDGKYDEIVEKHTDFTPKYNEVVTKHGQVATMHGEVEADAVYVGARKNEIDAIKTHIDQTKTQIDNDLTTAKSMINEGNGGVIDDTKNSDVSTWSSNELQRRLDLKADETTAYKDWNYKTITGAYTAENNDALFIEASSSFEIQLPASGKIRVVDKAGNFATHNIKLVSGSDKFVLNKDFQRVELFFFNGKWQITSGYLLEKDKLFKPAKQEGQPAVIEVVTNLSNTKMFLEKDKLFVFSDASKCLDYVAAQIFERQHPKHDFGSGFSVTNHYLFTKNNGVFLFLVGKNNNQIKARGFKMNFEKFAWEQFYQKELDGINSPHNVYASQYIRNEDIGELGSSDRLLMTLNEGSYKVKKQFIISKDGIEEVSILPQNSNISTTTRVIAENLVLLAMEREAIIINLETKQIIKRQALVYSHSENSWDIVLNNNFCYFKARNNTNQCFKYDISQNVFIKIQGSEFQQVKNSVLVYENPPILTISDKQKIKFDSSSTNRHVMITTLNGVEASDEMNGGRVDDCKKSLVATSDNAIVARDYGSLFYIPVQTIDKTKEI